MLKNICFCNVRPFQCSTHLSEMWLVVWHSVSSSMSSKILHLQSLYQHTSASHWPVRTRFVLLCSFNLTFFVFLVYFLFFFSLDSLCCMLFFPTARNCFLRAFLLSLASVTLRPGGGKWSLTSLIRGRFWMLHVYITVIFSGLT